MQASDEWLRRLEEEFPEDFRPSGGNWADEVEEEIAEATSHGQVSTQVNQPRPQDDRHQDESPQVEDPLVPQLKSDAAPKLFSARASSSKVRPITVHDTRPVDAFKALNMPDGASYSMSATGPIFDSIRPPKLCKHGCVLCLVGTFASMEQRGALQSYRARLSSAEADKICTTLTKSIRKGRSHITRVLVKHADELMKRWNSGGRFGSEQEREELLKEAAPDLANTSFFMACGPFGAERDVSPFTRSLSTRRKLQLPWLNVKRFKTHPDALFVLLHHRSQYGPADWQLFDAAHLRPPFYAGAFDVD